MKHGVYGSMPCILWDI